MQGALPAPTGRPLAGKNLVARYGLYAGAIIAALIGLLLLPAIFHVLAQHDVQISDRFSLIEIVWLAVGVAVSGYLLTARGAMLRQMSEVIRARLEYLKDQPMENGATTDLPAAGAATAARLLDIVFLLVIQAVIRQPFVGVFKAWAPEATLDGGYVVLVVLIALILLISLRNVSRPLLDHFLWVGLDLAVPTAGFATPKVSDTFTRLTRPATTTRTASGQRTAPLDGSPANPVLEPTIASPDALEPTMVDNGSDAATVVAPESGVATVVELARVGEETIVAETPTADAEKTIVASPDGRVKDKTILHGGPEEER